MEIETGESLWVFACGLYGFADVKNQCLELQDVYEANVDVVLWLCWLHCRQLNKPKTALAQALQVVGGVNQELLGSLRTLRGELLASSSFTRVQEQQVRRHIVSAELAIEKVLLQRLQDLEARLPEVPKDQEPLTLSDYLDSLGLNDAGATARDLLASTRRYVSQAERLAAGL